MMMATIVDIRRLWVALRRIISSKSLLRRLGHWIFYFWSLIRRGPGGGYIRYDERNNKKPTQSTFPPPPTSYAKVEDICTGNDIAKQNDADVNMAMTLFNRNGRALCQDIDTISLTDPTIAFSQHPYFTAEPTTMSGVPPRRPPIRGFSISDPALPTRPLDDTLSIPGTRRSFEHLQFSDSISLNVPSLEAMRIPRAASPSHSIIHPLPPVQGPAGMPTKLNIGLGVQNEKYVPLIPLNHERYSRNVKAPEDYSEDIDLEPLETRYSYPDPPGWTSYLHPEGVRYFCDTERRIYTDANMYELEILVQVNEAVREVYDFMRANSVVLSPTADLVLDFVDDKVYYYFADHRTRTVFYLDKMKTSDFPSWYEVRGASSLSHFAHLIEAEYWWHVFLFPSSLTIQEEIINELRDVVIHGIGDSMTSPYSTMTYSIDDLYRLLSVINSLKKNVGTSYGGSICTLSRFMWGFSYGRFLHWHGQPSVRLTRDASAHGSTVKVRSLTMRIVSWLLFSAPDVHLRNLEKIWVDKLMYGHIWKHTILKLIDEWQEFTLFSTVLLNANVAFLAIQTIDQNDHPYRSPGQVSSYISTIVSIGSVILSLLLVRLNRTKEKESAEEASDFLTARAHPKYGLEVLAVVYSLPYALLMWGVVSFLIAIAWMCMADANPTTRILTSLAWFIIAVMIALCVWMGWEKRPEDEVLQVINNDASSVRSEKAQRSIKSLISRKRLKIFPIPFLRGSGRTSEDTVVSSV